MPNASRWGALVVASLPVVACSSAPVETTRVPTPALSPVASASAAPALPAVSDFVDLIATPDTTPGGEATGSRDGFRVPYGHGVFTLSAMFAQGADGKPNVCAIVSERSCAFFTLKTGAATPDRWPVPVVDPESDPGLTERGPFAAPHVWKVFAGGRDAVYALREDGQHIDRIDDQGKVTPFAFDEKRMKTWRSLFIVEHEGHMMLGGAPVGEVWEMVEVSDGAGGKERSLGPASPLDMVSLRGDTAHDVRMAAVRDQRVIMGSPRVMALPDAGDEKNRWALVWLQLIAPPMRTPAARPQPGVPLQPTARPVRGATRASRHDCSGSNSRSIRDPSVTKRAHVTRFVGARQVDDQIAWTGGDIGLIAEPTLSTGIDGDRITVSLPGEKAPADALRVRAGDSGKYFLRLERDESVLGMAFDQASGEGVVVVRDEVHGKAFLQRFDRDGSTVGTLSPMLYMVSVGQLARVEGKWLSLDGRSLRNLTDRTPPLSLPDDGADGHDGSPAFAVLPQGPVVVTRRRSTLVATPVGPAGFTGPPVVIEEALVKPIGQKSAMAPLGDTTLFAITEPSASPGEAGKLAWRSLSPGGEWHRVDLAHSVENLRLVPVTGDVIAVARQGEQWQVLSLQKGTSILVDRRAGSLLDGGPFLDGGQWLLPGGSLSAADEALVSDGDVCRQGVMTGPGTMVLGCRRPTERFSPVIRVGLRTHRRSQER